MALNLIFSAIGGIGGKAIGFLSVDVFTSERVTLEAEVTDHPIEGGAPITDHVYNRPLTINVRGTVDGPRRQAAYQTLRLLHRLRLPTIVSTGLQVFPRMVMTSLDIPRTVTTAAPLEFVAEFRQVTFVSGQTAPVVGGASPEGATPTPGQGAADTAAPTANAGKQSTTAPSPSTSASATSTAQDVSGQPSGSFLSRLAN